MVFDSMLFFAKEIRRSAYAALWNCVIRGLPYIQQMLIIENLFILFFNILHLDLYTFACQLPKNFGHSDCGVSKTCLLNASNASSGVEKRCPFSLSFTYGNDAHSGLYGRWLIKSTFRVLKNLVFSVNVWELALLWWRMIHLRRSLFLIFLKTIGKPMVMYNSKFTVLR